MMSYVLEEDGVPGENHRLRATTILPHTDTGIRFRGHRYLIPVRRVTSEGFTPAAYPGPQICVT